jgi:5'-nucleotidase/UDP-sugar diphosphatase
LFRQLWEAARDVRRLIKAAQHILIACLLTANVASGAEVTFLFWSDRFSQDFPVHTIVDNRETLVGGAGALAGMIDSLRRDNPNTLVLVAGGEFSGAPVSALTKGRSQVEILNRLGIDAMVPGEHEFDYGWKSLQEVMRGAKFKVLLANVMDVQSGSPLFESDTVMELSDARVGIIGLIDPEFKNAVMHEGVLDIEGFKPVAYAAEFVSRRREDCDLLVALSYLGWAADSALAAEVKGLDIIISGKGGESLTEPRVINDVLIVRARPYGRQLGVLKVTVDTEKGGVFTYEGELLPVAPGSSPLDAKLDKFARKLEKKHTRVLDRKIGTLNTDWTLETDEPCNLAQWVADRMLEDTPLAALAVINAGSLRQGLPRGPISEKDIWEICPYDYPIVIFQIAGSEMIGILKRQISGRDEFITWSGLKLWAENGELRDVFIGGNPLNWREDYAVVATGFFWDNLDKYLHLSREGRPSFYLPGANQREILIKAVENQRIISSPLDDRWSVKQP